MTPLMVATRAQHRGCISVLLKHGSDVSQQTIVSQSISQSVGRAGLCPMMELVLAGGAMGNDGCVCSELAALGGREGGGGGGRMEGYGVLHIILVAGSRAMHACMHA